MENITNIRFGALPDDSPYVKPFRLHYTQNSKEKSWDLLKVHDSVSIILFNTSKNVLLFVKQFRPAVYYGIAGAEKGHQEIDLEKYPPKLGVTIELCAGIVDKKIPLVDIAREEIHEEVGYTVPSDRIEQVMTYRAAVGTSGSLQTLFYCEVNDSDKSHDGGGVDDELIEVVEYTVDDAKKMLNPGNYVNGPPSFLFGVLWFLTNKAHKFVK